LAYNRNYHFCDSNAEHCYLNLPEDMVEDNPLDLENIKEKQDEDNDVQHALTKHPTWYSSKNINDVNDIPCYTKPGDNAANWKGVGYMAWKWICISLKSWMVVLMVLVQKQNPKISLCLKLYGPCLKLLGTKRTDSSIPRLKEEALFLNKFFRSVWRL
jgi:hypothetical protein